MQIALQRFLAIFLLLIVSFPVMFVVSDSLYTEDSQEMIGALQKLLESQLNADVINLHNFDDVKLVLEATQTIQSDRSSRNKKLTLIGFFEKESIEEYSGDSAWEAYTFTAKALKTYADAYSITDKKIISSLNLEHIPALPSLFLLTDDGNSLKPYQGAFNEQDLSAWVMQSAFLGAELLSLASPQSKLYTNAFFASHHTKFILVLDRIDDIKETEVERSEKPAVAGDLVATWLRLAQKYTNRALFAYMLGSGETDLLHMFGLDSMDLPRVVAIDPLKDWRYRSNATMPLNVESMNEFIASVLSGKQAHIPRSEKVILPHVQRATRIGKTALPLRLYGLNVEQEVVMPGREALLLVHYGYKGPMLTQYRLRAEFELLARACAKETDRVLVADIDANANDIPTSWLTSLDPQRRPTLLWFPAMPHLSEEDNISYTPRKVPTSAHSLQGLVQFLRKESSFGASLQLPSKTAVGELELLTDALSEQYANNAYWLVRNEDRVRLPTPWLDWAAGEIVFDGKRWHVAGFVGFFLAVILESCLSKARSQNTIIQHYEQRIYNLEYELLKSTANREDSETTDMAVDGENVCTSNENEKGDSDHSRSHIKHDVANAMDETSESESDGAQG